MCMGDIIFNFTVELTMALHLLPLGAVEVDEHTQI